MPLRPTRPTFSPAPTTKEASRSRVRSPISMVREEPTIIRGRGDQTRSGAFVRADDGGSRRDQPAPVSHSPAVVRPGAPGSGGQRGARRRVRGPSDGPGPPGGGPWPGRRAGGWATAATSTPCPGGPGCGGNRPARSGPDRWTTLGSPAMPRRRTSSGSTAPGSGARAPPPSTSRPWPPRSTRRGRPRRRSSPKRCPRAMRSSQAWGQPYQANWPPPSSKSASTPATTPSGETPPGPYPGRGAVGVDALVQALAPLEQGVGQVLRLALESAADGRFGAHGANTEGGVGARTVLHGDLVGQALDE